MPKKLDFKKILKKDKPSNLEIIGIIIIVLFLLFIQNFGMTFFVLIIVLGIFVTLSYLYNLEINKLKKIGFFLLGSFIGLFTIDFIETFFMVKVFKFAIETNRFWNLCWDNFGLFFGSLTIIFSFLVLVTLIYIFLSQRKKIFVFLSVLVIIILSFAWLIAVVSNTILLFQYFP